MDTPQYHSPFFLLLRKCTQPSYEPRQEATQLDDTALVFPTFAEFLPREREWGSVCTSRSPTSTPSFFSYLRMWGQLEQPPAKRWKPQLEEGRGSSCLPRETEMLHTKIIQHPLYSSLCYSHVTCTPNYRYRELSAYHRQ